MACHLPGRNTPSKAMLRQSWERMLVKIRQWLYIDLFFEYDSCTIFFLNLCHQQDGKYEARWISKTAKNVALSIQCDKIGTTQIECRFIPTTSTNRINWGFIVVIRNVAFHSTGNSAPPSGVPNRSGTIASKHACTVSTAIHHQRPRQIIEMNSDICILLQSNVQGRT